MSSFAPALVREDDKPATRGGTGGSNQLRYMAFVDGLRAVSILAVVGYHIGVPGISGGFVGVDVFFVISGFLIINQIRAGLSSGRFSIVTFYAHRSLRIVPPYLLMLAATYAVAPFLLPTTAVDWDFVPSAILSPLMGSNIAFFLSQGYFDISGIEKPLLHTWTLSVEEQFYFVAPILLVLAFRLGHRRFGVGAASTGVALGLASLIGAIAQTSTSGPNAAFYLAHLRAWEFLAGGLICEQLAGVAARHSRIVTEIMGWSGIGAIVLAMGFFDADMSYPSWHAAVPVAGAALVILSGLAQPATTVIRLLSQRWLQAIGLVSYGWYLWHWPILSFIRITRLRESSLLIDGAGGGLVALALACLSYRLVERPIRRWRKSPGGLQSPLRIVLASVAACLVTASLGAASALGSYWHTESFLAANYGVDGKGVLDNGCEHLSNSGFPDHCFEGRVGEIVGDSHASVLFGSLAKRFDPLGFQLVSMARGSCYPLLLSPSLRDRSRRDDCAKLIAPFERLLARPAPPDFAIITGIWIDNDQTARLLSDLISEFDRTRTRILLIGPVPIFARSSLECVVLSDRYDQNRERCTKPRAEVETATAAVVGMLSAMPDRFPNVRYIDPINLFCDRTTCRPFWNNDVFYSDEHHLLPAGADRLYDGFENDFLWLAGRK